jgi:hypothetical protein
VRSNCLVFSVQRLCDDGYIIIRKSRVGWWPHFMYAKSVDGIRIENFVPQEHIEWSELPWWKKILPIHIIIFTGHVIDHDRREAEHDRREQDRGTTDRRSKP